MERTSFEQWKPREVARLLALVETERRYYQEMMAALPAALVVLAHDRTILSANVAFRRLVGLSGEELRKRSIEQILPSDELIERIRSVHVHGDTAPFSISMGERRFHIAAASIRSWEDEMEPETLLLVQPTDAAQYTVPTAARGAAPAFSAPVAPAEPSIDLAMLPVAVWQADASTFAFTYAGGAAQEILGYPAAHWLTEPLFFSERIHPEDRAAVMALYQSVAGAAEGVGTEAQAEFRALNSAGDPVWCREMIRVSPPGEGARRIAGILSAIGERRQLEAHTITAARVDALRGLSSRLAHDLNNPLMIVTGYGEELLNALPAEDPIRSDMTEVLTASGRISELAGQLLGYTRPLANPPFRIDLSKLIADLEPRLRELAGAGAPDHGIEVEVLSPEGIVWTLADPEQLAAAIAAMAAFALESTTRVSRLRVICGTSRLMEQVGTATLKPGIYARLCVQAEGEGVGVPPGVFESILTVPNKPSGPAVARAYLNLRQWGGDSAFSSSAARGSAFAVYLPYVEPPQVEPSPAEPAVATSNPAAPEIAEPTPVPEPEPSLGTVLVVEDEPGIRGLVRKILKRERFDVIEAGSAEDALAAASAHGGTIGLLLTDVILPVMGGRELAETLVATNTDLKVVYISGFTDDESVRAGQFPPGSMFLQKPFTLSALVTVVKRAFDL